MSVTGRYANAFQSVERKLSNQKGSTSCYIFQWQNFCSGNAAAKMFTVKKKERKTLQQKYWTGIYNYVVYILFHEASLIMFQNII